MKKYLSEWSFMRSIRLGVGLMVVVHGVYEGEWLFILLGTAFSMLPLFNVGCSTCDLRAGTDHDDQDVEVVYEEVRSKISAPINGRGTEGMK